jgi:thiamine-phosphate pyrophosphorylase
MTQLYLTTPSHPAPDMPQKLNEILARTDIAAVRMARGDQAPGAYASLVGELIPAIQNAGAAALLDGIPDQVARLGADGVHLNAESSDVPKAIAGLKPEFIVGVGGISSRHQAMTLGDSGVDYLMFGEGQDVLPAQNGSPADLARWWAQNFQVPAVWQSPKDDFDSLGCEFFALNASIWTVPDPAGFLDETLRALP